MKTIQEIKDEVANKNHFNSWIHLLITTTLTELEDYFDLVAKRYAEEALKEAAERAFTNNSCNVWNCEGESVNKDSILDIIKELK